MNHRPVENVLSYDLLVYFVEPGIDLFPIKQTQSAGDHRKDRQDDDPGVISVFYHRSYQQAADHARQSAHCRQQQERLKAHFGGSGRVTDHVLW